jgi:outer membrane protein assembly factor BamB
MPSIDQLVFIGLNGWVAALDRDTGEVVWYCSELKSGATTLLLDGDRLIASTNGYLYCLDPQNGRVVWKNPMTGYGTGIAHLVSVRGQSSQVLLSQVAAAEAQRAAAASATHTGS